MSTAKRLIRRSVLGALAAVAFAGQKVDAQALRSDDASYGSWLVGNMAIAGSTAAIGALFSHRPVLKAFAIGAAAGAGVLTTRAFRRDRWGE